nr:MAG TPA: hypothetical protein [Caudoviricetes sp.]
MSIFNYTPQFVCLRYSTPVYYSASARVAGVCKSTYLFVYDISTISSFFVGGEIKLSLPYFLYS